MDARKKTPKRPPSITRYRFHTLRGSPTGNVADHPAVRLQKENYGWPIHLVTDRGRVRIAVGCRWLGFPEASEHWGRNKTFAYGCSCSDCTLASREIRARARKMLALLPKLKQRARRYGWL